MNVRPLVAVALAGLVLVAALFDDAAADPPVSSTTSMSYTCPPVNLFNPDAGAGVNGIPECSSGQSAVRFETESASAVYFCGKVGCTRSNATSVGFKRSTSAAGGNAYEVAGNRGTARCISGTVDAGVVVAVQCAQY